MQAIPLNELSRLPCYEYHGTLLFIDPKITLGEIRDRCPKFFSSVHHQTERRRVYKGHIIVKSLRQLGPERTTIYAFDVRTNDTYCVCTELAFLQEPNEFINAKLKEPLKLQYLYEEVEVQVPAKVQVFVCRNFDGEVTAASVAEFTHVGGPEQRPQDKPGDTFVSAAWDAATAKVRKK